MAQETQRGALCKPGGVGWGGRWERGSGGRGYMYTCGWFTLRFDRKTTKKQLSFNKKKLKKIIYSNIIRQISAKQNHNYFRTNLNNTHKRVLGRQEPRKYCPAGGAFHSGTCSHLGGGGGVGTVLTT